MASLTQRPIGRRAGVIRGLSAPCFFAPSRRHILPPGIGSIFPQLFGPRQAGRYASVVFCSARSDSWMVACGALYVRLILLSQPSRGLSCLAPSHFAFHQRLSRPLGTHCTSVLRTGDGRALALVAEPPRASRQASVDPGWRPAVKRCSLPFFSRSQAPLKRGLVARLAVAGGSVAPKEGADLARIGGHLQKGANAHLWGLG
jgi:hypothetical protein